jgi:hypothetical protein
MGRVPLLLLQGRRSRRNAGEVGQAARALLPRNGGGARRLGCTPIRSRGELVIEVDGSFSFEALQMRLRKLAGETPASLIASIFC